MLLESTTPTRLAAIDIGTNTALMIIAEVSHGAVGRIVADEHSIPRLGEGVYTDGHIGPEALERTIKTIEHYRSIIKGASVSSAVAVATAALRNAVNKAEVQQQLSKALGNIPLYLIDGLTEADITYSGVVGASALAGIIDIGGGSTELVWPAANNTIERLSLDLGAVRLTEAWKSGLLPRGIVDIGTQLPIAGALPWYAVAGTPVALSMLDQGLFRYDEHLVNTYTLTAERVTYWRNVLLYGELPRGLAETIPAGRLDILPAGSAILANLMHKMNMPQITVSTRGLRHGVVQWMAERRQPFTT